MVLKSLTDSKDNKAKKDKIHNIKLSGQTFDKFHRIRTELTLNLGKTRIENDNFLRNMLYFVEKHMDDFVSSCKEGQEIKD
jgi:hypothetical protein